MLNHHNTADRQKSNRTSPTTNETQLYTTPYPPPPRRHTLPPSKPAAHPRTHARPHRTKLLPPSRIRHPHPEHYLPTAKIFRYQLALPRGAPAHIIAICNIGVSGGAAGVRRLRGNNGELGTCVL
ncbi:hypothetical protein IQ07DRAFT_582751, partial [Pyrenochaeta sp. DS3sAY3a]